MKTYINAQNCNESGDMGEDSVRRLLIVHYMLEDFHPKSDSDPINMHNQKHSNGFKTQKSFKNQVRALSNKKKALSNKKSFQQVRALTNKRLPNEEKSDIRTYQNAHIYYERRDMGEDASRRLQGSPLVHYVKKNF